MLRTGVVVVRHTTRGFLVVELDGLRGVGDRDGDGLPGAGASEGNLLAADWLIRTTRGRASRHPPRAVNGLLAFAGTISCKRIPDVDRAPDSWEDRRRNMEHDRDWTCRMARTPPMGSPASESSAPTEPDTTVASGPRESQPPAGDPSAVVAASHDGRPQRRVMRKKILLPIILAVIGGVLSIIAIALYPRPKDFPTPFYSSIEIKSAFEINYIEYRVIPVHRSLTEITLRIILAPGVKYPPPKAPAPLLNLDLPPGVAFQACPVGSCGTYQASNTHYWVGYLHFKPQVRYDVMGITGAAFIRLFVKADHFGYAFNAVTAAAAMPEVNYFGKGSPLLEAEYDQVPSPNRYDWSAFQPSFSDNTRIAWAETVTNTAVQGRVSVGVNHANQAKDNTNTFIAGALIGLAGGALLSAVQEAFRAHD